MLLLVPLVAAGPVPPPRDLAGERGLLAPIAPAGQDRLGEAQSERIAALVAGQPSPRSRQTLSWLGILVEFEDREFPESYEESLDPLGVLGQPDEVIVTPRRQWFQDLMNRTADYYATVSRETVVLQATLADSLVSLSEPMITFGDDATLTWEQGVRLLASAVVDSLDAFIDFSAYDLVTFIHAGPGQESDLLRDSPEQIWSGYLDFESLSEAFADSIPDEPVVGWPGIPTDDGGFVLERFGVAPELEREEDMDPPFVLGALGVYVHQLGSYLGLLSLGDYLDPRAQGAGNYDLMASGLWNALGFVPGPPSAFNRFLMGWADTLGVDPAACASGSAEGGLAVALRSWEQSGADDLLYLPISDREYFLIENRNQDADDDGAFSFDDANGNHIPDNGESLFGAEFDYYTTQYNASDQTPGSGLFVWKVDAELLHLTYDYNVNLINAYNDHYGVMLLEADGYPDLSTVSFDENAYGGDFDAFRAAGGPASLPLTATAADANSLPDTRSAEGADSGWRLHSVGPHGSSMDVTLRYDPPGFPRIDARLAGRLPVGDPVAAQFVGDPALDFAYLTTDGDSLYVHLVPEGDFSAGMVIARIAGQAAGSLAAGHLNWFAPAQLVLLTTDGRLYVIEPDGSGGETPVATVNAASRTPVLTSEGLVVDVPTIPEAGMLILVLEDLPDDGATGYGRCVPRWFHRSGVERDLAIGDDDWGSPQRGLPVGDVAISRVRSAQGYDLPDDALPVYNICLADSSAGGSQRILQLAAPAAAAVHDWPVKRELALTPGFDANVQLAAGDLDGDGIDDLMIEAEGQLLLWYPAGRFGGPGAGETLFRGDLLAASEAQALLPADLNGDGILAALTATSTGLAAYGPEGSGLADWALDIPQTDPEAGLWRDPSRWLLSRRDEAGIDTPVLFTLDGRLFSGHEALVAGEPDRFVGGDLVGSPVLADFDDDGLLELRGLSGFEPLITNTAAEDTLETGRVTRLWQLETDWPYWPAGPKAWAQGGADAARSRRLDAARNYSPPAAGTVDFDAAYAYPNPAADRVNWRVETTGPLAFTVELYDLEGQLRLRLEGETDGFSAWEGESSLEGLASAVYFYIIRSETGGALETGRLAVLR